MASARPSVAQVVRRCLRRHSIMPSASINMRRETLTIRTEARDLHHYPYRSRVAKLGHLIRGGREQPRQSGTCQYCQMARVRRA